MATKHAPFTDAEVTSLNDFQAHSGMHPFICGTDGCAGTLRAISHGWICPEGCGYTQNWAHDFMADDTWRTMFNGPQARRDQLRRVLTLTLDTPVDTVLDTTTDDVPPRVLAAEDRRAFRERLAESSIGEGLRYMAEHGVDAEADRVARELERVGPELDRAFAGYAGSFDADPDLAERAKDIRREQAAKEDEA